MLYALWVLAGWCGTPYPGGWWRGPRPPQPPEPWWAVKAASILGGIAGGWITQSIIVGHQDSNGIAVLATLAGALVTGGFLGGLVGLLAGGRGNAGG